MLSKGLKRSRRIARALVLAVTFLLAFTLSQVLAAPSPRSSYEWNLPAGLPKPVMPADNPMTAEKVELGRHLFYEKRLSITGKHSCASCHEQKRAFTDGKLVGIGATGEKHPRNSMSLANIAYNSVLTWANPLITRLESQTLVPMFGEHPIELGMVGREEQIQSMLRQDPNYQKLFAGAFGNNKTAVNLSNITKALASFERSLISFDSPYDRYRFGGDKSAISPAAKRGERLFGNVLDRLFRFQTGKPNS